MQTEKRARADSLDKAPRVSRISGWWSPWDMTRCHAGISHVTPDRDSTSCLHALPPPPSRVPSLSPSSLTHPHPYASDVRDITPSHAPGFHERTSGSPDAKPGTWIGLDVGLRVDSETQQDKEGIQGRGKSIFHSESDGCARWVSIRGNRWLGVVVV
eukprot:1000311-Amorphochlora_amoeboformis.AAC.1